MSTMKVTDKMRHNLPNKKAVVKTTQVVIRTYFAEAPDPEWVCDGIVMQEMDHYSDKFLSEDILSVESVSEWPEIKEDENINGAVMSYDTKTDEWVADVMWRN